MQRQRLGGNRRQNGPGLAALHEARTTQARRTTPARFPLRPQSGPGVAAGAGADELCQAARSMAGSQPVSASNAAAFAAISPFLSVAMVSADGALLPSATASRMSALGKRPK